VLRRFLGVSLDAWRTRADSANSIEKTQYPGRSVVGLLAWLGFSRAFMAGTSMDKVKHDSIVYSGQENLELFLMEYNENHGFSICSIYNIAARRVTHEPTR
jgi:hypothetical protein